jgi:hypothetical protein
MGSSFGIESAGQRISEERGKKKEERGKEGVESGK